MKRRRYEFESAFHNKRVIAMKTTKMTAATTARTTLLAVALLAAGHATAAAQLHVRKTAVIDVPVDKVWELAKDFGHLDAWHPAVAKDEIVDGKDDEVGAVRLLTLKGGGTIKEKLLGFNDAGHRFKYEILEGALPVSGYVSHFSLKSLGPAKTLVVWSGSFESKGADDKTAKEAISGVYTSGLDNLKKTLASKSP
jgi:mxaD protein